MKPEKGGMPVRAKRNTPMQTERKGVLTPIPEYSDSSSLPMAFARRITTRNAPVFMKRYTTR